MSYVGYKMLYLLFLRRIPQADQCPKIQIKVLLFFGKNLGFFPAPYYHVLLYLKCNRIHYALAFNQLDCWFIIKISR